MFLLVFLTAVLCNLPEGNQSPLVDERENAQFNHKKGDAADVSEREEGEFPRENGNHRRSNGIEAGTESDRSADRHPDVVDDAPSKSRSVFPFIHVPPCYADSSKSGDLLVFDWQESKLKS